MEAFRHNSWTWVLIMQNTRHYPKLPVAKRDPCLLNLDSRSFDFEVYLRYLILEAQKETRIIRMVLP